MGKLKRSLSLIVACTVVAAACGGEGTDTNDYCDALRDLMSAAPDYGKTGSEFDSELAAYVTALDQAAAAAPVDQAAALQEFAGALRFMATDPTADGMSDRLGEAVGGMLIVQEHGELECGLDYGAAAE